MPPARTGTVVPIPGGGWRARIRLADGSRPWYRVPANITSEARARDWAQSIQEREDAEGKILAARKAATASVIPDDDTVDGWFKRHFDRREAKGQVTVKDSRGRYKNWIKPIIGAKAMAKVDRADIDAIVRKLDAAVSAEEIAWKTSLNIYGEVTSAFDEACSSKEPTLRVRDDNPTTNVKGPDRGIERAKPILFPSEVVALLSCEDVPLNRREAYAVAVYTGARSNELAAITGRDVDFEHLSIAISKQVDRKKKKETRPTKTRRSRPIDIEPALVPLLKALVKRAGQSGRLLHMPPDEDRAALLRKDLARAKCDREDLTADDELRAPIAFHNLRDTCLTHMAVRGDAPLLIQWRGGHTTLETTQGYIAQGQYLRHGFGMPFPSIPAELVQSTERSTETTGITKPFFLTVALATPTGIEGVTIGPEAEILEETSGSVTLSAPLVSPPNSADPRGVDRSLVQSDGPSDPLDDALKIALSRAIAVGRYDLVSQFARELEARRLARTSSNVVDIATKIRGAR